MRIFLPFSVVALACGLLAACSDKSPQETPANTTYPVISPVVLDTFYHVNYVAEINSLKNVEIRSRIKGYIDKIHVDEGQKVRQGQLLFSISDQEYREEVLRANAQLKSAIAEAKSAELALENIKLLVRNNTVSKAEQDIAEAKLAAMQAKVEEATAHEATAKLRLGYTQLKAPFNGVIDRIPYKVGSLIDEGSLLTTLSDNSEVFAYFNVSEKEYLTFVENMKDYTDDANDVGLILANNRPYPHDGNVETIEGEFNSEVGSIAFRARFPNPDRILRHGSSGKVVIRRNLKNALVVPQKSTFELQDRLYVYVLDAQNQVKMKSFVPQLRIPHLYVIESGLSKTDRVVYEGIQNLRDGMSIQPEARSWKQIQADWAKE